MVSKIVSYGACLIDKDTYFVKSPNEASYYSKPLPYSKFYKQRFAK